MEFNNYKFRFVIRILILTVGVFAFVYSFLILNNFIRSLFSFAFCVISLSEFFHFVNKTNNDFKSFLNALIYEDFTNYYSSKKRKESSGVYDLFNRLNEKYRKIAFEKEVQHAFLQTIIKHISIGIFVFNENKDIVLVNNSLLNILQVKSVKTLNDLENKHQLLFTEIEKTLPEKPKLLELAIDGELLRLSINMCSFKLDGKPYKLVSVQDINIELDEQEIIAWQKLIRVLTHEIMNSVTPISSLTSSLNTLVNKSIKPNKEIEPKHLEYLSSGLVAVQERSEGLLRFTESYKKLTQLPHPEFLEIDIIKLFDSVLLLHESEIEKFNIDVKIESEQNILVFADKTMLEQLIINLFKNAVEALKTTIEPLIVLKCFKAKNDLVIQVIDNGKGIPEDKIDKIFIPFFTTKTDGSGIGLSFAKQVMRLHKGSISVKSTPNETIFTLKL